MDALVALGVYFLVIAFSICGTIVVPIWLAHKAAKEKEMKVQMFLQRQQGRS